MVSQIEEMKEKLGEIFNCTFVEESRDKDYLFFSTNSYDTKSKLNFLKLMQVARIFGTLDFDVLEEFSEGCEYSEYTKDPDVLIKSYRVAKNKINTGLPKGLE